MGIDFIRSKGGQPYVKRWAKGYERANTPDLFDIRFSSGRQVATAALASDASPQKGGAVMIQQAGAELIVFDGLKPVGRILNPPPTMRAALEANHGLARGVVDRLGVLGQTAEIRF